MPVYKDNEHNTYYVKCYYTDYTGTRRQKKKRGFKLQREAKEWEHAFLERQAGAPTMLFKELVEIYLEDMRPRLKPTTVCSRTASINTNILPYFGNVPVNEITAADVRKWQGALMQKTTARGEPHKPTYLKKLHMDLSCIFNYAVQYYNLASNPCRAAGSFGSVKAAEMKFWTLEEYRHFIAVVDDIQYHAIFQVLFYTGMRVGELLALTRGDVDLSAATVRISKTMTRIDGENVVTSPKTRKSNRTIALPCFLVDELSGYFAHIYKLRADEYIFTVYRATLLHKLKRYAMLAGVKEIRIHDMRHSHAALLVELGVNPLLIADRLGHEDVSITLNTYAHLYPSKQSELTEKLNLLVP